MTDVESVNETCGPTRRDFLGASTALFAWAFMPKLASAAGARDPRFLTIILRGGLDGLSAVPPLGDPNHIRLRRHLALVEDGPRPVTRIDGFFGLHPSMPNLARLYARREAIVVHAVATPYRERSHFDGQDVLESGMVGVGGTTGWLARALAVMPRGQRLPPPKGLSVGGSIPLLLRGDADITAWAPPAFPEANEETIRRVLSLYQSRDSALHRALQAAVDLGAVASANGVSLSRGGVGAERQFVQQAESAARFMRLSDGPRIAAMSFDGWDTHADQGPRDGRLAALLGALDAALGAFHIGMGPVWKDTVVAVITEFGRTARANGTDGTDHGTATVAFLLGGALEGGRIIADWPGLAEPRLFEGRDLAPTTDLRVILSRIMMEHLQIPQTLLARHVFTDLTQPLSDIDIIRS